MQRWHSVNVSLPVSTLATINSHNISNHSSTISSNLRSPNSSTINSNSLNISSNRCRFNRSTNSNSSSSRFPFRVIRSRAGSHIPSISSSNSIMGSPSRC